MQIVRHRMLCIVTPQWPLDAAQAAALGQDVEHACQDIGVVHFASLALLPPMPGQPEGALPSLMLEIVTDEGIRPHDLLSQLAFHPSGAFWALYQACLPDVQQASTGERYQALLKFMLAHLSLPVGAFVGPRDRGVAQSRAERSLLAAVRRRARMQPPAPGEDRAAIALRLARWVAQQPGFDWAASAAPRSFWRGAGASAAAKLRYVGGALLVVAVVLSLPIVLWWLLRAAWSRLHVVVPVDWHTRIASAIDADKDALLEPLCFGLRALAAGVAVAFVLVFVLWLPVRLWPAWRGWLQRWSRELDRPTEAWSARLSDAFAWGLLAALCAAGVFVLIFVLCGSAAVWAAWHALRAAALGWAWPAVALYVGLMVAAFAVLLVGLQPRAAPGHARAGVLAVPLRWFRRWFNQPHDDEVPRAQRVHASIEECEARLIGGTSHMISLTELRTPYWWSAGWTRLVMGFVTAAGHVFFTEGRLGSTPGIHFGHWHIVDDGRRLLFISNFDGSFGGYLDDFIKGPSEGTTLFWRWTELLARPAAVNGHPTVLHRRGFPPTRLLARRGVKCELRFKAYARDSMVPHLLRYDATRLTLQQKLRATELRDALVGERNDVKDDIIMRALES